MKPKSEANSELTEQIKQLKTEHPDWSLQKIADETGTHKMKVKRILDRQES